MATFVLVHGGWHGGWCWADVSDRLAENGHEVFAPTLTGLAERRHLFDAVDGPDTHVADIVELLDFHDLEEVILVGHSYGGFVITGAATTCLERIAHLVYLDAFVPTEAGQAATGFTTPERRKIMQAAFDAAPNGRVAPVGFENWAADPEVQEWLRARTTPHPRSCFEKGVSAIRDPSDGPFQRHFLLCARYDPSPFQQFHGRYADDPRWNVASLDCLHDAMIEIPEELADRLVQLA